MNINIIIVIGLLSVAFLAGMLACALLSAPHDAEREARKNMEARLRECETVSGLGEPVEKIK